MDTITNVTTSTGTTLNTATLGWDTHTTFTVESLKNMANEVTDCCCDRIHNYVGGNPKVVSKGETVSFIAYMDPSSPEWNCKSKDFVMRTLSWSYKNEIVNIDVIVPKRVVEVTIFDHGEPYKYKQVCKDPDVFDLRFALALAMVKHENKNDKYRYHLTSEGIEEMADRSLRYYKEFAKEVDRAIKAYNSWLKEKEKKKLEEEERKAIIERRRAKNKKRKEKMKAKKHDEEVNTIAEAIRKSKENK